MNSTGGRGTLLYMRRSEDREIIDVSAYIIRSGLRLFNVVYIMILWFRGNVYLLPLYKTFTNVCRGAWLPSMQFTVQLDHTYKKA